MAQAPRPATAPSDESKERFRRALEAKKNQSSHGADGVAGASRVQGPETDGATRRQFRRKSGSA